MRNNTTPKPPKAYIPPLPIVNASNKSILVPLGLIITHYMKLNGLSDEKLAKLVGCSDTMIFRLRKGDIDYCGISIISRIALSFGFTLADWLKVEQPKESIGAFGSLKP